jgi:hypothetical protein
MEVLFTILTVIFVALILAAALTIGFSLLVWCIITAIAVSMFLMLRERWRRFMFVRRSARPESTKVIEGEYKDITDRG